MDSFRYEECYKALGGPSQPHRPDANFRDLLVGQVGHIHRRGQGRDSMVLSSVLEQYVDDRRRHQNEKYIIQEEPNLNRESEAGGLSEPPLESFPSL